LALCSLEEQRCSCSLCNSQGAPEPCGSVLNENRGRRDWPAMRSPLHRAELEASGGGDRREERVQMHSLKTEQRATAPVDRRWRARELHPTSASRCRVASAPTGNPSLRSSRSTERSREALLRAGLLRKEVIQPHLPVRLPCYDFTPIANPTFDSSFPKG
jgi:hypothetical protein